MRFAKVLFPVPIFPSITTFRSLNVWFLFPVLASPVLPHVVRQYPNVRIPLNQQCGFPRYALLSFSPHAVLPHFLQQTVKVLTHCCGMAG